LKNYDTFIEKTKHIESAEFSLDRYSQYCLFNDFVRINRNIGNYKYETEAIKLIQEEYKNFIFLFDILKFENKSLKTKKASKFLSVLFIIK